MAVLPVIVTFLTDDGHGNSFNMAVLPAHSTVIPEARHAVQTNLTSLVQSHNTDDSGTAARTAAYKLLINH